MRIGDSEHHTGYHVEIDKVDKNRWADLLRLFDDASLNQTWSSGAIMKGEDNLSHIVLKKDKEIVGISQITIQVFPLLNIGVANVNNGPLWRKSGNGLNLENFRQMLNALKTEYVAKRGFLLRVWPNEFNDCRNEIVSICKSLGFMQNHSTDRYRTFKLDISPPLEVLRKNLGKTWRLHLNRAEKSSFQIIEGSSDDLYGIYLSLLKEMLARKKFLPGVDYNKYRLIQNDLPEDFKMKIMVCEFEGEPICSIICSAIGDTGTYLLGATGNKGLKLHGSNFLHWHMVKWLKEKSCIWYDLGGIDPVRNPGTYQFKRGLAGTIGKDTMNFGQFEIYNNVRALLLSVFVNKTGIIRTKLKSLYRFTNTFLNK